MSVFQTARKDPQMRGRAERLLRTLKSTTPTKRLPVLRESAWGWMCLRVLCDMLKIPPWEINPERLVLEEAILRYMEAHDVIVRIQNTPPPYFQGNQLLIQLDKIVLQEVARIMGVRYTDHTSQVIREIMHAL